jgi:hypothetical protein
LDFIITRNFFIGWIVTSGGHVVRMEGLRNAYRILVGKPEGKRSLWRPRRRWDDNITRSFGTLRRADPPSKESYLLSTRLTISELILNGNRPESVIRQGRRRRSYCIFLWYDTDRIENDASNNYPVVACLFVAAETCLPSHCLATIRWDTHSQQGYLISLLLLFFFQNKECRLKWIWRK